MGCWARLIDRIDAKVDRPADQSVLQGDRNPGSESMLQADSPEAAKDAARITRRSRNRRRWQWAFANLGVSSEALLPQPVGHPHSLAAGGHGLLSYVPRNDGRWTPGGYVERPAWPGSCRLVLLGQDSGDAEHVSIDDSSARHSWHGITLEAGSHHDLGIRRLVEPDQPDEHLPAIRQMPGGSLYLKLHVETRAKVRKWIEATRRRCRASPGEALR
jgi:hypothetical protein